MSENNKLILGISCGDIGGVGLEILLKAFSNSDLLNFCKPVLYAPSSAINYYKKLYSLNNVNYHVIKNPQYAASNQLNVIKLFDQSIDINPGRVSKINNQIALQSLDLVIQDLKNNLLDAILTLPINKQGIALVNKDFVGHTEYLSDAFENTDSLMLLCNDHLKIATATNHIPVSKISNSITKKLLDGKIKTLLTTLKIDFLISKPKIAILGLNPHCGDGGLIGSEDLEIIKPLVDNFFHEQHLIFGPYSADGFFGSGNYKHFDAILGMYHDQALIPFKSMSFGSGVNYTAGLPIIRVSPDHGVGYDIAGKGMSEINSLLSAIFLAIKIHSNRKVYFESIRKIENI